MIETAYLHIGCEKTGSTTLQEFFAHNRGALAARGVLYPRSPGAARHYDVFAYALPEDRELERRERRRIETDLSVEEARAKFERDLEAEMAAARADTLILSEELMAARLKAPDIARLRDYLARFAKRIVAVCYIRRQDEIPLSMYSTALIDGAVRPFRYPPRNLPPWYDYHAMLTPWAEVLGRENIRVRRFGRDYFPNGDLIDDSLEVFGVDGAGLDKTPPRNPSMDAKRLEFLRRVNKALDGRHEAERRRIAHRLQVTSDGERLGASRLARKALVADYRPSNKQVARTYLDLPGRLFTHPFPDDPPADTQLRPQDIERLKAVLTGIEIPPDAFDQLG